MYAVVYTNRQYVHNEGILLRRAETQLSTRTIEQGSDVKCSTGTVWGHKLRIKPDSEAYASDEMLFRNRWDGDV
jgi:hypothetical protein